VISGTIGVKKKLFVKKILFITYDAKIAKYSKYRHKVKAKKRKN